MSRTSVPAARQDARQARQRWPSPDLAVRVPEDRALAARPPVSGAMCPRPDRTGRGLWPWSFRRPPPLVKNGGQTFVIAVTFGAHGLGKAVPFIERLCAGVFLESPERQVVRAVLRLCQQARSDTLSPRVRGNVKCINDRALAGHEPCHGLFFGDSDPAALDHHPGKGDILGTGVD